MTCRLSSRHNILKSKSALVPSLLSSRAVLIPSIAHCHSPCCNSCCSSAHRLYHACYPTVCCAVCPLTHGPCRWGGSGDERKRGSRLALIKDDVCCGFAHDKVGLLAVGLLLDVWACAHGLAWLAPQRPSRLRAVCAHAVGLCWQGRMHGWRSGSAAGFEAVCLGLELLGALLLWLSLCGLGVLCGLGLGHGAMLDVLRGCGYS